jgi:hypothetical protein
MPMIFGSDKGNVGVGGNTKLLPQSARVVRPETSRMIIYDPRQIKGICIHNYLFHRKWSALILDEKELNSWLFQFLLHQLFSCICRSISLMRQRC